jgi:Rod binding domain-containing protein
MDGIELIALPPVLPAPEAVAELPSVLVRPRQAPVAGGDAAGINGVPAPAARGDEQKQRIARDFESVLLGKLFDQVQASTGGWGLEEEDAAAPQVQGLFWMHLARALADQGGLGLWKDIYQYLRQMNGAGAAGAAIDEEL